MQTILITGANGFVGYYLTQRLISKGYYVVATGKGPARLPFGEKYFLYETMDFANEESVKAVFKKFQPHIVVHCGAISKPDECELNKEAAFLTNVTGTIYLLEQASLYKSHFIFLSTDFVFAGKKLDYAEEDERAPVNYYGLTKVLAEDEVTNYPFDWSIVRPILIYGHPRSGRQNILTTVALGLKKGEELKIFNDQLRKPTYVEDLAGALVTIIEKKKTGIYNICGSDVLSPYDMACAVADHLGLNKHKIKSVTAETFEQPAMRPPVTGFNLAKAQKELGYEPTPFSIGLQKTFED